MSAFIFTPDDIAKELNVSKRTVYRQLQEAGLTNRGCGEYTLKEIVTAFCPDVKVKRVQLLELQRQEQALRVGQMKGELLDAAELWQGLSTIFIAIRQIVTSSQLPAEDQKDILENIAGLDATWKEGTKRRQRLVR
jgi:AraC-like DNA-binding protein